jgi:hypothetical protein
MVEFAIIGAFLLTLAMGVSDLGRAYHFGIELQAAARAGMRVGVQSDVMDIGDAIRSEANPVLNDSSAVWGVEGPGSSGVDADCTDNPPLGGDHCGDPNGCPPQSFTSGQLACFAIRTCTFTNLNNETCASYSAWDNRPLVTSATEGLQVLVVYRFTPMTPVIASLAGSNGALFLRAQVTSATLYTTGT